MNIEMKVIERNDTWVLIDLPPGATKIGVKCLYKTKLKENGEVDKHKARLMAKGYTQQQRVDFSQVVAHVARMDTVRMIFVLKFKLNSNLVNFQIQINK